MSAPRGVDFYFDYLSPYAYFASLRLPSLCARHGAELRWRPVLFAGLLDHFGHRGPAEIPAKALYTFRDCARYAARHGIAFRAPRHHPFRPLAALRVSLAVVAGADQARVAGAIYRMAWAAGGDPGDPAELAAALDGAGLPGRELLARAARPEAKDALRGATQDAIARGVFGVPTMIACGELLFGNDRLDDLELVLAGRDPLAGVDLAPLASRGPAAHRSPK